MALKRIVKDHPASCSAGLMKSAIAWIKDILELVSKLNQVAEVLADAFGPLRTRQKVEKCLTQIGCKLMVLSLVFALTIVANGKMVHNTTFLGDETTFISWGAVFGIILSLGMIFAYGVFMVYWANKMATAENYTDGDGHVAIILALVPILIFIAVLAVV